MTTRGRTPSDKCNGSIVGFPEMEYFWAIELTAEKPSHEWSVKLDDLEDDDADFIEHTLFLRMAVLGASSVPGEDNLVEMSSTGEDGTTIKGAIINLTKGQNSMGTLSLTVDGKVGAIFTLLEGSGPVIISGNHLLDYPKRDRLDNSQTASELSEDDDLDEDEEEEDEEEEDEEEAEKVKGKQQKRKGTPKSSRQKQKAKMEVQEEEDDDDIDDDDEDIDFDEEEESDSEDEKSKKKKKKGPAKEAPKVVEKGKGKAVVTKDGGKKAKKTKK